MAIRLQSKPNVTSPGAPYPYGDIKDNPGDGSGTPVNRLVYGDFHQFFAKLLADAGITGNDLPENTTNTFQYILALNAIIATAVGTETAARVSAVSAEQSARISADSALSSGKVDRAGDTITGSLIVNVDVTTGNRLIVTAAAILNSGFRFSVGGTNYFKKTVQIGDWVMLGGSSKLVAHGLGADFINIREVSVMIIRDDSAFIFKLEAFDNTALAIVAGVLQIDSTNITLINKAGVLPFDSTNFDATSFNRGFVTITYEG